MPAGSSWEVGTGFAAGTSIRTSFGEVAVESLAPGDRVITPSGEREVRRVARTETDEVAIRIAAGAFGTGMPSRELVLAASHGVLVTCVDEVLVPVGEFANDATVARVEPPLVADILHVVLDAHDILFANGLPCESRRAHDEASCRPFCDDPLVMHAVRVRLHGWAREAGWRVEPVQADLHLEVDGACLRGDVVGDRIRFVVPASPEAIWLVSRHFVPGDTGVSSDRRRLGIQVMEIAVDDGLNVARGLPVEYPSLSVGFHFAEPVDAGWFRWTDGRARLPEALWRECQGAFFLKLRFSSQLLVGWQAPD